MTAGLTIHGCAGYTPVLQNLQIRTENYKTIIKMKIFENIFIEHI
jgi:hypothetical protein